MKNSISNLSFRKSRYLGLWTGSLLVLSVLLLIFDYHAKLEKLHYFLSAVISPLEFLVNTPYQIAHDVNDNLMSKQALLVHYDKLRAKQLILEAKLQRLQAIEQENRQLRALLGSATAQNNKVTAAQLLAVDMNPYAQQVIINKGNKDSVYVGQPVLDAKGLMGQIISVGPLTARVLLITDPQSGVPVQDARNALRGIIVGDGDSDQLQLIYMPDTADVKVGDLFITSGLGAHYPFGYPVGTVTQVMKQPGWRFAKIYLTPSAEINRSREVLLLWPQQETIKTAAFQQVDKTNATIDAKINQKKRELADG